MLKSQVFTDAMAAVNGEAICIEECQQDALIRHMEVSIVEAEKRINGPLSLKEHYTVYLIETKVTDSKFKKAEAVSSVWRRYSEFEILRNYLEHVYHSCIIPPLPEKKPTYQRLSQNRVTKDLVFVERRRIRLEHFLLRLVSHPVLSWDRVVLMFLQTDTQWNSEKQVLEETYVQLAEKQLKSIALRLRKPDEYFENLQIYSSSLQTNLHQFLRLRFSLADSVYGIHKLHANYGRVFSEWSALEKSMGDGLQKSGHYMDSFSSAIDTILEDEDLTADQIKEYLYFAQSLQSLCLRHTAAQNNLEKAQQNLTSQTQHKEKLIAVASQKAGFLARWASVPETEESRQSKMDNAEKSVVDAEAQCRTLTGKLKDFSLQAAGEVQRFNQQKEVDITESMAAYTRLQLQRSKIGLQTWKSIKQALEEMP